MDAKRIREIAAQTVTQILRESSTEDGFDFDAARSFARHAITQAVNETLEEAQRIPHELTRCTCPAEPSVVRGQTEPHAPYCLWAVRDAIRALKVKAEGGSDGHQD